MAGKRVGRRAAAGEVGRIGGMNDVPRANFTRDLVDADTRRGRFGGKVVTRFPREPNGYLHIGHAKAMCIDFGLARDYGGRCHLRFDDTNPTKESQEYVDAIMNDVRWLGFDWGEHLHHASDYFEQLYRWAEQLITAGKAYVDDQSVEEMREARGTLTEGGRPSPFRVRSVEENLDLFRRMRAGEFPDGSKTLRAKIDMTSGNINLRDPVMYRIRKTPHQRTGDRWSIYPMYDWAHGQSDSLEGVTHSICTLEYEDHRPLYDWYLDALGIFHPQQIEFARLNLSHTVMSKRKLLELVEGNFVGGWDDPRMPTLAGLRRRGYTPESIRDFCERIGVAKVRCTYDPATVGGDSGGRAVKGTIHWVSAPHAVEAEVRLYETLFTRPKPDDEEDFAAALNPNSLTVLTGARLEPSLASVAPGARFQFERNGYFCVDSRDSAPGRLVFNRTVGLRDTWAKIEKAT